MAGELALRAVELGKRFFIDSVYERRTVPATLRRWLTGRRDQRELWALRGVSFELKRGEILGVIGPNGAGKSTLLLLLAEILIPTEGRLEVFGRTDPFFQLAAGLQPRLSVLDNLILCSALLGMSGAEFRRALPEIVAFTGLEEYLQARYGELSCGMAARLPFAVAMHADLDILLVDEMLAVGDDAFQKKCLETFHKMRREGRTLVVVSHSRNIIESLCGRTLYLDGGRPRFVGDSHEATRLYFGGEAPARG